jgi:hypothetical protein
MAAFLGMRGTGDWVSNQMPETWRELILRLFPNGSAPLTAIMSKMGSESCDSPIFHWWDKELPTQRAAITHVHTDVLSTLYVSGGAAADTLYIQLGSTADCAQFKATDIVLLRDASDYAVDCNAVVTAVTPNGTDSYLTVKLIEADDGSASHTLANADVVMVIGTANEEGAASPVAKAYDPTERYNYTQIFRNSLEITNTAAATNLRTGDAYAEAKRDCLELHSIEMEKAFLWGTRYTGSGPTKVKPRRMTNGIIRQISTNVSDFTTSTDYSGQTWLQGGELWLDAILEQIFRYGASEKLCLAGSGAILGINQLAKSGAQISLTPTSTSYGLKVGTWITPFGTIYMKTHPLFSYETTNRNSMLILEPKNLKYRYLRGRDTQFLRDRQAVDEDSKKDEFLTEAGLELHFEKTFGYLNGVGVDNTL